MENFLILDGKSGERVKGYKGANLYCKVVADDFNDDGIDYIEVKSNGVPNYTPKIGNQIIRGKWNDELKATTNGEEGNPNSIEEQNYTFLIPKFVSGDGTGWTKNRKYKLPMGAIGVAVNGIPLYNQWADRSEENDANETEEFESCCGHPDGQNKYHYHQYPLCAAGNSSINRLNISSLSNYLENLINSNTPSPIIGYMFDGVPLTGPIGYDKNGNIKILKSSFNEDKKYSEGLGDLDEFNGIDSPLQKGGDNVYHYVSTITSNEDGTKPLFDDDGEIVPAFPYFINQYKYTPEDINFGN
jgi:hypothetical protein